MYSNKEYRDLLKKVHPEYCQVTDKGNDKWKESRVFWTVIYPDSLQGSIEDCCSKFTSPCALSPLHDQDSNKDGEIKKAHWHFLASYGTKKNPYQFYVDLCNAFGEKSFSTVEIVGDTGYAVRYLIHMNETDPLKFHYPIDSIKCFGGFEEKKYLFEKTGDVMDNVTLLMDLIDSKNFMFFDELSRYLRSEDPLLFAALVKDRECKNFVMNYLRGKEHSLWYSGEVEKGYTKIHMDNGTDKVIFNRQIKENAVAI